MKTATTVALLLASAAAHAYEYQYTVNAFAVDDPVFGHYAFPAETFDIVLSGPLSAAQPVEGLAYNITAHGLNFFIDDPSTGWQVFYAPGLKPVLDPNSNPERAALFQIDLFNHTIDSAGVYKAQLYVGGVVAWAAPPPPARSTVPEPATDGLMFAALCGLGAAALCTRHRARMTERV